MGLQRYRMLGLVCGGSMGYPVLTGFEVVSLHYKPVRGMV
jgi:hypothetical protein